MPNIPEIGVRLSAQGVQDVVNAFAKVRAEGKAAAAEAAGGFGILNTQLESLTELLPLITAGIVVEKLVEMGGEAIEFADNIGKLSEKTGIAAGALSVFSLAAKETDTSQESLDKGLVKLTKSMQDAANGVAKPKKAFADIGITLQDLKTKDPGQIFVMVANGLAKIENPGLRAQAAVSLFGRAGAELIPMMNKLAEDGFANLEEKARSLGVYIDANFVQNAKDAKEKLGDLEEVAKGVSLEFIGALLPAITAVSSAITNLSGPSGVAGLGSAMGIFFTGAMAGLAGLLHFIDQAALKTSIVARQIEQGSAQIGMHTGATQSVRDQHASDYASATAAIAEDRKELAQSDAEYEAAMKALDQAYDVYNHPNQTKRLYGADAARAREKMFGAPAATGTGETDADAQKAAAARSALEQSQAQNELNFHKLADQLDEAEDKRNYDAGLLSLDDYYDKRYERINQATDDELDALDKKAEAAAKMPQGTSEERDKRTEELGKIAEQQDEAQIKRTADLQASEDERARAKHDNALKEMEDEKQLQAAEGDTYAAEQTGLAIELQKYSELIQKRKDLTDAQKAAMVEDFQTRGNAKIDFGVNSKAAGASMDDMNQAIGAVQDQAAAGVISQLQAEKQIHDIEVARLPLLEAAGVFLTQNAADSKDPDLIRQAEAYNAALQKIVVSLQNVTTAQIYMSNMLSTEGRKDFEDFFTSIGDGQKTAAQAFDDLANAFEEMISRMISKLLIYYALEALVGWIAPNSSFASSLAASGPFGKYADGGWTGGVAGQPAGIVHGEEFVVRAGPAAKYMDLLNAINNGASLPAVRPLTSPMSYASEYTNSIASGGSNAGPGPDLTGIVQVINATGQPVKQKQTTGPGGKSIQQIIIGAVQQDIAAGGQVAKQLQRTYGVARGGVRRG